MLNCQEDVVEVLGICVEAPQMTGRYAGLDFHSIHGGRKGIETLRGLHFDFLLVGMCLPDMSVWDFLRHLKTSRPGQKWALVGSSIREQEEIRARMFGATAIFDTTPNSQQLMDLTARHRERARVQVLSGRFDRVAAPADDLRVAI